jgi:hypothetical protein
MDPLTQTRGEERYIELGRELLHFGREEALSSNNIARQTDAYDFQDCLKNQHCQVWQGRMGGVWWQGLLSMI